MTTRHQYYQDVPAAKWDDWRWQMRHRVTDPAELQRILGLDDETREAVEAVLGRFRMAVTPYYLSLIDPSDPSDPVMLQAVPRAFELDVQANDMADPLAEDRDAPTPELTHVLTHRYPDRVLLLVTDECTMYCRHCTRRRIVGHHDRAASSDRLALAYDYIRAHEEVRDVLISGGDPLTLPDSRIEEILTAVRAIPHVEIIRLGTRVPVVCPQRITPALVAMLKRFHPLYVNTHFNHPAEVTEPARRACALLADAGIPLGNQSVMLRGVNDNPHIMKVLVHELLKMRVRPYYVYQCDLSEGIEHFRTSVGKGIEMVEFLRGHTSGLAVPTYVVDAPGGGGKIPVMPQYLISRTHNKVILRNFEGVITTYSEPDDAAVDSGTRSARWCPPHKHSTVGLARLCAGTELSLVPSEHRAARALEPNPKP
jgi:lysine 2,3-aminomutase